MRLLKKWLLFVTVFLLWAPSVYAQSSLLTPEENLWLTLRNNTIVVYPEKNNPPFSYQTAGGAIQGLAVDFFELITKKLDVEIQYLTPRARSQVLEEIKQGKGDVILAVTPTEELEQYLVFTESFVTVPVVIVVRKDVGPNKTVTLNDYVGKRVAVADGSAIQSYINKNYQRIIIESVSDDEVGLQKIVLGETDAAIMDAASLAFLLSKQVPNSVKVVGSTGYDYRFAFAIPKEKVVLQSILEKGMAKVSTSERQLLIDKWIALPGGQQEPLTFLQQLQSNVGITILYILFGISIIGIIILFVRKKNYPVEYMKEKYEINELRSEVGQLEDANKIIAKELEEVRHLEEDIQKKIEELKK